MNDATSSVTSGRPVAVAVAVAVAFRIIPARFGNWFDHRCPFRVERFGGRRFVFGWSSGSRPK